MNLTDFKKGDYITRTVPLLFKGVRENETLGMSVEDVKEDHAHIGEPLLFKSESNGVVYCERESGDIIKFPMTGEMRDVFMPGWEYFIDPETDKYPASGPEYFQHRRRLQDEERRGRMHFMPFASAGAFLKGAFPQPAEPEPENELEGEQIYDYDYIAIVDFFFIIMTVACMFFGSSLAYLFIGGFFKELTGQVVRLWWLKKYSKH